MENWISAIIVNGNGEKEFHQFDNEEELRYFLAVHEECRLERATYHEDQNH